MEQIRVIKEMRAENERRNAGAIKPIRPRFMLWENVPGAFSSNKGEDFRAVLEETCRVADDSVFIPQPENGKWLTAGSIVGNGYSVAWRVLDAQYWGVSQRRRRIVLVADFAGERAAEILFVEDGLRRSFAPGAAQGERTSGTTENNADSTGSFGFSAGQGAKAGGVGMQNECSPTLKSAASGTNMVPCVVYAPDVISTLTTHHDGNLSADRSPESVIVIPVNDQATHEHGGCNGSMVGKLGDPMYCLTARDRHVVCYDARGNGGGQIAGTLTGDHQNRITDYTNILTEPFLMATGQARAEITQGISQTLNCDHEQPIVAQLPRKAVRRLTPLECERLQGFPDAWTEISKKNEFTEEEYIFWAKVYRQHKKIRKKPIPEEFQPKRSVVLNWFNKLGSESARYKAIGNSVAIPCMDFVIRRIKVAALCAAS